MVGGHPTHKAEDGGCKDNKKVAGVSQLQAPDQLEALTPHEKWKGLAGAGADSKDDQTRQSKTCHPLQQLPASLEES